LAWGEEEEFEGYKSLMVYFLLSVEAVCGLALFKISGFPPVFYTSFPVEECCCYGYLPLLLLSTLL